MAEVQEVMAEPIEQAIEPMSGLDQLVAGITAEAERLATEYQPREITSEDDFKQSKRERAGARKDIAALRQRYNDAMRAIKDAVAEADARTKAALAPLDAVDAGYKREVDAYEERWKLERRAMLAEEYGDFAPDLVPLVPFDRLMARYGTEKGKQWDARSLSDQQALAAMQQAVERIAADEQTIDGSPYDESDKAQLKADYFTTLDLSGALRRTQEAKEQRERVAQLERERAEREAAAAEAARRAAEVIERVDPGARAISVGGMVIIADRPEAEPEPKPIDTHSQMTHEEYVAECERVGSPLSRRGQHSQLLHETANVMGSPGPGERVPDYVFAGYGNAAQANEFVAWCDRAGVRRRVKQPTNGKNYKLTVKGYTMAEDNQLAIMSSPDQQGALEVRQQVNQIQYLMQQVLKSGEHYGVVPGTKGKPTLFQSGAEKIAYMFHLVPSYEVQRTMFDGGHREYEITCTLTSRDTGEVMGYGVGTCTTLESKYRYRNKWVNGQKQREENPDIADTYNTVMKMAKKRAFVDAVKSTTAASDIFTQDVEDLPAYLMQPQQPIQAEVRPARVDPSDAEKSRMAEVCEIAVTAGIARDEARKHVWRTYKESGMGAVEQWAATLTPAPAPEPEPEYDPEPDNGLYPDEVDF